jgi:rhamnogalacturonan endolyase
VVIADHLEGRRVASLDLFGDWREEIIVSVPGELRIYTTDIVAEDRRVSLMEDPIYRNNVAHQSMGYNAPPLTSYYFGRE